MKKIFSNEEVIVLASGSPRRRAYFEDLGLSFSVQVADIEERRHLGEPSDVYVRRLAEEKAKAVGARCQGKWVVAADTVIHFQGNILEKPVDSEDAVRMLLLLCGTDHRVQTGVCLYNQSLDVCDVRMVSTRVFFWNFSRITVKAYVNSGEPMDKAGGYGIQGKGAFLVREIQGSYSNVVGLPLCELLEMLTFRRVLCEGEEYG